MTFIYDPISNTLKEESFPLEAGAIYNKELFSLPSTINLMSVLGLPSKYKVRDESRE